MQNITYNPYLFIRELRVQSGATWAYREIFHEGVNIIRGENSTGKSTIMSFLLYGLGGSYSRWVKEALSCDAVYLEVEANGAIITLRREIEESGVQPMYVFWGSLEESLLASNQWEKYGMRRTEKVESFSQAFFRVLGFPEIKTEEDNNITFHQILRLLFIDQISSPFSLMIEEKFDYPLTRQAIGDMLLGTYNNDLYENQLLERKLNKELQDLESQQKYMVNALVDTDQYGTISKIESQIDKANSRLSEIELELTSVQESRIHAKPDKEISGLADKLKLEKKTLNEALATLHLLEYDVLDSEDFLATLRGRLEAINQSLQTRSVIEQIPIKICPHCLSKLELDVPEGHCILCTQELANNVEPAQIMRMRQELSFQIKESDSLLEKKHERIKIINSQIPLLRSRVKQSQRELDSYIKSTNSTRDSRNDQLLVEKGSLERELEHANRQLIVVKKIEVLKENIAHKRRLIESLQASISDDLRSQERKTEIAMKSIKEITMELLKKDGQYEQAFASVEDISLSFRSDSVLVDGRNNFSASSVTYLKNAVHFAILFSSTRLDFFRYPRLIMCDNMEDKGMQEQRSKNFQINIARISEATQTKHQIIFSTSMIAEELNNTTYCIGPFYEPGFKTLKID